MLKRFVEGTLLSSVRLPVNQPWRALDTRSVPLNYSGRWVTDLPRLIGDTLLDVIEPVWALSIV